MQLRHELRASAAARGRIRQSQSAESSRDAGTALGVSHTTVQEARRSGGNQFPGDTITGRDGKTYAAKKPEHVATDDSRIQYDLLDRVKPAIVQMNQPTREALETWFNEIHHNEIKF